MMAHHRALPSTLNPISTAYSLSLLAEYTHSLDSLPLDLSRNFADLRELDAVLSSSMVSITSKIYALTEMIERGVSSKEERLWLLTEIMEEAARLKPGGEDKIRVASQAADSLKSHMNHLRTLVELLPDFDPLTLARRTVYPHVAPRSFMPVSSFESGRRRRANAGSLLHASVADPSPAKRKRMARDDDLDILSKSPKKDRTEGARSRNNARRRAERAVSPSESLVSVTSHIPQASSSNLPNARGSNSIPRAGGAPAVGGARQRVGSSSNQNNRNRGSQSNYTPNPGDAYHLQLDNLTPPGPLATTNGSSRRGTSVAGNNGTSSLNTRNQYGGGTPLSTSSATVVAGGGAGGRYAGRQGVGPSSMSQVHAYAGAMGNGASSSRLGTEYGDPLAPDWTPPNAHQLEGPGMPVQRGTGSALGIQSVDGVLGGGGGGGGGATSAAADAADAMDGDEVEDERYCFCGGVSYGEMIACDDETCEREWFHIACVGLTAVPQGQWFCEACGKKRNAHRPSRGGRRKNVNARSAKAS